ncbi:YggS family pyridoxal phosphate-dependent enzyme [Demetria terragena]|uniref:YggS family pyridoxal phosphate-dependent enzyme n=1 Tax=Demetria terragena TaxID=63959 RepID=UPI00037F2B28|nr:YggS family pyridoxal phosphate-dependent enzyme [Demetria terragena]
MTDREAELARRLQDVLDRIADACTVAGRSPHEVTLVVVTKFFPAADLTSLVRLGVTEVGENRHQEAADKLAEVDPQVRSAIRAHFIGQVQSNKASAIAGYADVVQSVDRLKVAKALARGASERGKTLDITLQVDLQGTDEGRGGVQPADLPELAEQIASLEGLRLRGLMAVAPLGESPRPAFDRLAALGSDLRREYPDATWLSAGMSGDMEEAVAAGATHLRVGSAILGSRPQQR